MSHYKASYTRKTHSIPECPNQIAGEDRDAYIARVSAWERELQAAIRWHLDRAADLVTAEWNEGYVAEYLTGTIQRYYSQPRPKPAYVKQVIPAKLRTAVFERDGYRCQHCGGWKDLRVDHIHPESKGGTLDMDNLQTLCQPCNSRKGTR